MSDSVSRRFRRLFFLILILLLSAPFAVRTQSDAGGFGILPCSYLAPDEVQSYADHLCDGDPFATATLHKGESLTVRFAPDSAPSGLFIDFYRAPAPFTMQVSDAQGDALLRQNCDFSAHHVLIPIACEGAVSVTLTPTVSDIVLSECFPVSADFTPPFPDTDAHADVLVVLDRPGDETERLGGLLALLAGEHGLSVQVVYLIQADGFETHQCMQILRDMGVARQPVFGDILGSDFPNAVAVWSQFGGEAIALRRFTRLIRDLTPDLLLTLDPKPDRRRPVTGVIAGAVLNAAELASDAQKYPDSAPHTVKKVYSLSETGGTVIALDTPLYGFGGAAADALADELYTTYTERRVFRTKTPASLSFALMQSAVGADAEGTDLLEHLKTESFSGYRDPTPAPADTPVPTDTPEPAETPVPTEAPAAKPSAAPTAPAAEDPAPEPARRSFLPWVPAIAGAVIAGVLFFLLRKRPARRSILPVLLPLLIGAALTVLMLLQVLPAGPTARKAADVSAAPAVSDSPAPTDTPAPTAEPVAERTEAPTEEPTATPDPNDAVFLSGDGEEYELDFENGHWQYKNNVLAIEVNEIHAQYEDRGPLVYYVADIRMRGYSSYRSGLRKNYVLPHKFAREDGAVLAITGDCLNNESNLKGCLIRKGRFYADQKHADVLILDPEHLSMRVESPDAVSARVLTDHGVRDVFSFGPILLRDGKPVEEVLAHRLSYVNPRVGIGMIEPGHWIAIVTDGRQTGYSMSITLEYFAQMFSEYGCTVAYNLDGGSSCAIVFMGETLNRHAGRGTNDLQRSWIDCLEFGYSTQLPDPAEPTIHDGYRH